MDLGVFDHLDKRDVSLAEFGMGVDAVGGGLRVPGADRIIARMAITVSIEHPEASHAVRAETLSASHRRGEG